MTKDDVKAIRAEADKVFANVHEAIKTLTAEKPFIVFDRNKDQEELEDEIYDLPYGYTVNKYGDYLQGAIQQVHGNEVVLFLTGDDFGQEYHISLGDVPFSCQIDLLEILENETL